MKYIVYTEILEQGKVERWYYGLYEQAKANAVAESLGNSYPIFHCVCAETEAQAFNILNLPISLH